jgi:hypothetical protein
LRKQRVFDSSAWISKQQKSLAMRQEATIKDGGFDNLAQRSRGHQLPTQKHKSAKAQKHKSTNQQKHRNTI